MAEIVYLEERRRIAQGTLERLLGAMDSEFTVLMELPFDRHVAGAMVRVERSQAPDLPDRIIAAASLHRDVPMISSDRKIQLSGMSTLW